MKDKYDIGKQLGILNHLIKRNLEKYMQSEIIKLSAANGYILFYLHDNKDRDVFQKDFEGSFGITRSTASKILSLMETKELIARKSVEGDARLKKIVITEKGEEMRKDMIANKNKLEKKLVAGFSPEEIKQLYEYMERMKDNLK